MAPDVIAIAAGIAGGLLPPHPPKRRERKPDPVAEAAAIAKRARRAAKRAEDERRTAEGRSRELNQPWRRGPMGLWDWTAVGQPVPSPQWRIRSRERRALPRMERPWWAQPSAQARGQVAGWSRGLVRRHVAATRSVRGGAL